MLGRNFPFLPLCDRVFFHLYLLTLLAWCCRGVEWLSQTAFLSWSSSMPNPSGLVRNELMSVDITTGASCFCLLLLLLSVSAASVVAISGLAAPGQ